MLNLDLDLKKVTQKLDGITKTTNKELRPATQAGAQVLHDRVRQEAPVSERPHKFHIEGRVYGPYEPGTLRDAVYQVYSKSRSSDSKAVYEISFNHTKAPYGFMILRGTSQLPANDFIGRAFDAAAPAAAAVVKTRLQQSIKKAK